MTLARSRLTIVELVEKLLIARRFLERVEVAALDVFDDRERQRLAVVGLDAVDRHLMQTGALRGPPAALSGDDFEHARRTGTGRARIGWIMPFSLMDAVEFREFLLAKLPARIARIGAEKFDR